MTRSRWLAAAGALVLGLGLLGEAVAGEAVAGEAVAGEAVAGAAEPHGSLRAPEGGWFSATFRKAPCDGWSEELDVPRS